MNLQTCSCTCQHFDLDHITCSHAIVACRYTQMSCYSLCFKYYIVNSLLASYNVLIFPLGQRKDLVMSTDIISRVLLPQKTR